MKKNYVTPTNEMILLEAENILTITVSKDAEFDNIDGVDFGDLVFD